MDEAEKMDPVVIKALFDQGVSNSPLSPLIQKKTVAI
jgi:hypothetical protein